MQKTLEGSRDFGAKHLWKEHDSRVSHPPQAYLYKAFTLYLVDANYITVLY
jgi:hypothetical protein